MEGRLADFIPARRGWPFFVIGASLAISTCIDCAVLFSNAGAFFLPEAVAAFLLVMVWAIILDPETIFCVDKVSALVLVLVGLLGIVSPFLLSADAPLFLFVKALCSLAFLALWLVRGRRTAAEQAAGRLPAANHEKLIKPLGYLIVYETVTCVAFGIVSQICTPDLASAAMNTGLGFGVALGGVVIVAVRACTQEQKGIDVLTRGSLIALILGWLVFLQADWIEIALALNGIGFGLFSFLVLRLAEDLRLVFGLKARLVGGILLVYALSIALGHGIGWLIQESGLLAQNPTIVIIACIAVITIVTVYGLSSERVWVASGFRDEAELESEPKGGRWQKACEVVASSHGLTPREAEVLVLLSRGRNAAYIEEELVVSSNTVKSHMLNIYRKLGVHSQQELISLVEHELQYM
ncbi:MAG: helix-turn-helix transcriptional regulator [Coriobacteriales bacterium]